MKKKFLAFASILVLVLSSLCLVACGNAKLQVTTFEELKGALANANNKDIVVVSNMEIPSGEKLEIASDVIVTIKQDVTLTNAGTITNNGTLMVQGKLSGEGVVNNSGTYSLAVRTRAELLNAFEVANEIVLYENIAGYTDGAYNGDITVKSVLRAYDFVLDLNGHNIEEELNLCTYGLVNKTNVYFEYGIKATVKDSKKTGSIGSKTDKDGCYYGLMANGKDNLDITVQDVKLYGYYGGFYTNGSCEGAKFTFQNVVMEGGEENLGVYLASNANYSFTNCTFNGGSGIYTKSGTYVLDNCTVTATGTYSAPKYNGNGAEPTGSALIVDSAVGYKKTLNITVNGGSFSSVNGYGVEEVSTYKEGQTAVSYATVSLNNVTLSGGLGKVASQNNTVTQN